MALTKEDVERCLAQYGMAFEDFVRGIKYEPGPPCLYYKSQTWAAGHLAKLEADIAVLQRTLENMVKIEAARAKAK